MPNWLIKEFENVDENSKITPKTGYEKSLNVRAIVISTVNETPHQMIEKL